jgi:hypothetical protein
MAGARHGQGGLLAGARVVPENGRAAVPSSVGWAPMQGLLAAAFAILVSASAGCSFHAPDAGMQPDGAGTGSNAGGDGSILVDTGPRCAGYDFDANGHKYRLTQGVTWDQAKASCDADGGYLLKIETSNEDGQAAFLLRLFTQEVWIGLRDVNANGTYVWTDGTAPTFTHWSGTVPAAGDPDCIMKITSTQTDDRWYARSCTDTRRAVCECNP